MATQAFDTIIFPGGGNRCWWQAGLVSTLQQHAWQMPESIIAGSAGAAVATALITRTTEKALETCKELYHQNPGMLRWIHTGYLPRMEFAQSEIYPAWLLQFIGENEFTLLQRANLKVSVAKLDSAHSPNRTAIRAVLRYIVGTDSVRSSREIAKPRNINGLVPELLDVSASRDLPHALQCLRASAAAAPLVSGIKIGGQTYFDGGYICSNPSAGHSKELTAKTSQTLLTRHYKNHPMIFQHKERTYLQPSQTIPVSTWGCTKTTDVDAAFRLGQSDAYRVRRHIEHYKFAPIVLRPGSFNLWRSADNVLPTLAWLCTYERTQRTDASACAEKKPRP